MVELLDPAAGQPDPRARSRTWRDRVSALPLIQPDGELLSTDAAPEMVEVARRRAVELGLTGVRFAVEDVAELSLRGRLGRRHPVPLRADARAGDGPAAAEIARVLRPGGQAVLAVWASSELNPWMTASGQGGARARLDASARPDAPGPFRLGDPERLAAVVRAAASTVEAVEESPSLGGGVARRVVGRDLRHVADADDAPRTVARRRDAALAARRRGSAWRSTSSPDGLTAPGRTRRGRHPPPLLADAAAAREDACPTESSCRARLRRARRRSTPSCSRDRGSGWPRRPRASRRSPTRRSSSQARWASR